MSTISTAEDLSPGRSSALRIPALPEDPGAMSAAFLYAAAGLYVGPLAQGTKHPGGVLGGQWPTKTFDDAESVAAWFSGTNYGLFLHAGRSGFVILDVDRPELIPAEWWPYLDAAPFQSTRTTDPRKGHYVFAMPDGRAIGNPNIPGGAGEVRGQNGVIVAAPTRHELADQGGRYEWVRTGLVPVLPDVIGDLLPDGRAGDRTANRREVLAFLTENAASDPARAHLRDSAARDFYKRVERGESRHSSAITAAAWIAREAAAGFYPAREAFETLRDAFLGTLTPADGPRRGSGEFSAILSWAVGQVRPEDVEATRRKLTAVADLVPAQRTPGDDRQEAAPVALLDPHAAHSTASVEHRGQLRLAERMVTDQGEDLRHVFGLGWHTWDGARWARDEDGEAHRRVIRTVKDAIREAADLGPRDRESLLQDVRKAESSSGMEGVLSIAGKLRPCAVSHKRMDTDPEMFNTPDGTVDLRTCQVRPHAREDHMTKMAAAGPTETPAEVWESFLRTILPDAEVRSFVQRLIGYSLIGEVREHVMPIFTGKGANGKGTFRDAVLHALGDYAIEIDPEMLMESKHTRHGTFKMRLRGARLVFCSETEKGRAFGEATMKRLTGGDPIEANLMHKDPITFDPSHTLIMLTNQLPQVSGDDPAVWRRILVVPFDVVIPEEERDGTLPAKLKAVGSAVLSWAIAGCLEYQRIGLKPPAAVRARTAAYQADSDALARFIGDRCMVNAHTYAKARDLFTAYDRWCSGTRERAMTEKEFSKAMEDKGYGKVRRSAGNVYPGLSLLADDESDDAG